MAWGSEVEGLVATALGARRPVAVVRATAGECRLHACAAGSALAANPQTARSGPAALPLAGAAHGGIVLTLVGQDLAPEVRRALVLELARAITPGGALVLVDHNRPRQRLAALRALVGRPRVPGRSVTARWRRLAYPTAREALAAGFTIEWLRFAAGERLQVVLARKR